MTTDTQDTTALTANDPEAGSHIRLREHLTDDGGAPSKFAGMYGTIYGRDPFGGYLLKIGAKTMHFARGDFIVVAEPSAEQLASAIAQGANPKQTQPQGAVPQLVNVPPLEAINSTTNPRRRRGLDIDSLRALADSILAHGLGNPILVRPLPASRLEDTSGMEPRPAYEVIAGERRWRAAQLAELPTMPMVVRHMDDQAVLEMQLVENIEREDLDPMEEAEGFALLRDKLGYTVEQIAERMGKGRGESYVRKRMKLLDLTPESREAMYEGTLMLSTGLAVAHYPAATQAKAVKIIKGMATRGTDGKSIPAPFRTVVLELYRKLNTLLKTAAFDTLDPGLVFNAGPCSTCPKRSQAETDLFTETRDAGEDSCLDTVCWEAKKTAHVQRVHADAQARGLEVIDGAEAEKIIHSPHSTYAVGYRKLDDTAWVETSDDGENRGVTWADALRAQGRKAPKPVILINPHTSKAVEMIPDDVAEKLKPKEVQERRQQQEAAARQKVVDTRPPELLALLRNDVRRAVLLRAFDAIRATQRSEAELRLIARNVWEAEPELTERYLGWEPELDGLEYNKSEQVRAEKLDAMDADQLAQAITMGALEFEVESNLPHLRTSGDVNTRALEAIGIFGIDILAVQAKVDEDLERQRTAAAAGDSTEGDEQDEDAEEAA